MYIYVCIYIYLHICVYVYIYIYIFVYTPPIASSAVMSTPTEHCQLEDETVVHEGEDWPLMCRG